MHIQLSEGGGGGRDYKIIYVSHKMLHMCNMSVVGLPSQCCGSNRVFGHYLKQARKNTNDTYIVQIGGKRRNMPK